MKKTISTFVILLTTLTGFTQQEKVTSIELNGRIECFEVSSRYQLLKDTVYHLNSGLRINPEYDVKRIEQEDYVIFTYPDFHNGKQYIRDDGISMKYSEGCPVNVDLVQIIDDTIAAINGKTLAVKKTEFDLVKKTTYYSVSFCKWKNYNFSSGIMTIPFKLRPKIDTIEFNVTTDITLGGYFGLTKRISTYKRYYITLPATLGLSYINVTNNNTSNIIKDNATGVVPGFTWSSGIIFQLEDFNIGFVLGQDFASGVGDKWIYNGKLWYSFAIGYNFLSQK
jgi:hypothetical protein